MADVACVNVLRHWLSSRLDSGWRTRHRLLVVRLACVCRYTLHLLHLDLDLGANLRLHFPLDPALHLTAELLLHHLTEHFLAMVNLVTYLLLEHIPQQISAHVAHLLVE